jgi:hypothetical protein
MGHQASAWWRTGDSIISAALDRVGCVDIPVNHAERVAVG